MADTIVKLTAPNGAVVNVPEQLADILGYKPVGAKKTRAKKAAEPETPVVTDEQAKDEATDAEK